MAEKKEMTTIWISKETKNKLDNLGKKGDSYEDIILKLVVAYGK